VAPRPHLEVGYVGKAHGLSGEVGVRTFDPSSEALFEVDRVVVRLKDGSERELSIDSTRTTPKEILVCFEGVEDRSGAEKLVGGTVLVFREDLEPPAEGEFFQGDLVGLLAVDEAGAELGRVEEIWESGPVPNLVIRGEGKPELLVPFADEFVPQVDMAAGRIIVRPPELTE